MGENPADATDARLRRNVRLIIALGLPVNLLLVYLLLIDVSGVALFLVGLMLPPGLVIGQYLARGLAENPALGATLLAPPLIIAGLGINIFGLAEVVIACVSYVVGLALGWWWGRGAVVDLEPTFYR